MRRYFKITMNIIISSVIVLCLSGCDPVSQVKEGVLQLDKSVTVGDALDGYQYFSSTEWTSGESSQGKSFVECSGDIKNSSMRLIIQFQINKDDTFEFSYAGLWRGEKEVSNGGMLYLMNAYRNEVIDNKLLQIELIKNNSPEFMAELEQHNL